MRVAILVPHLPERAEFFERFCVPAIEWIDCGLWATDSQPGTATEKRNRLSLRYPDADALLFCDDDVVLGADCVDKLADAMQRTGAAIAYCDYVGINLTSSHKLMGTHPKGPIWTHRAGPWDPARLRRSNYISTMSLVRRDAFLAVGGFDESLARFQDWDLWLRMAEAGHTGVYVPQVLFHAYYLPGASITADVDYAEARKRVEEKHGL